MPLEGLLGRKLGMTQIFDENGQIHAVTVVEAGPVIVTQVKTAAKDGYAAVQVGYGERKKSTKPMRASASVNAMPRNMVVRTGPAISG